MTNPTDLYRAEKAKRAAGGTFRLTPLRATIERNAELERRANVLVRGKKPDSAETERWAKMYLEDKRSLRQIAELEGVKFSTIHKRLKQAGIPIRVKPKKVNRLLAELELRIVEIERRLGIL